MPKPKIIVAIMLVVITALAVSATIAVISSSPINNQIAVDQLNGGDEAWYTWRFYTVLRNVAPAVGSVVVLCSAIPLVKIIITWIKEKTK